jgi:hypothetical protein
MTSDNLQIRNSLANTGFPGFDGISSKEVLQLSEHSRMTAAERSRVATASGFIGSPDSVKSGPYCRFKFVQTHK